MTITAVRAITTNWLGSAPTAAGPCAPDSQCPADGPRAFCSRWAGTASLQPSIGALSHERSSGYLSQFTEKKRRANAFDLRYGETVMPEGPGWELCERVLARRDVIERLSEGW